MKRNLLLALAISLLIFSPVRAAEKLVDTGQPAATSGGVPLNYPYTLFAQFILSQPATVGSIQGWVAGSTAGNLRIHIYQDNGDVPGNPLYGPKMINVPSTGAQWATGAGLNWPLSAGTYWVAFGGTMGGLMGTMPGPAPAPLAQEGVIFIPGTEFVRNDSMDIGVRIIALAPPNPSLTLLLE
jgi:hypothetical protein